MRRETSFNLIDTVDWSIFLADDQLVWYVCSPRQHGTKEFFFKEEESESSLVVISWLQLTSSRVPCNGQGLPVLTNKRFIHDFCPSRWLALKRELILRTHNIKDVLKQWFPTGGTRTPRGTQAHCRGYVETFNNHLCYVILFENHQHGGTHGMTNRLRGYTRQKRLGNTVLKE